MPSQSSPALLGAYKRFSVGAALLTLAVGLAAAAQALANCEILSWLSTVNATAFILTGAALLAAASTNQQIKKLGLLSGALLLSFCLVENFSYTFDAASTGVFSSHPYLSAITSTFGLMPATDAIGFLLLALSLITIDLRLPSSFRLSEVFSMIALLASLMTLIGVFFGVPNFCILVSCMKIAPFEAAAFIVPCLSVLTARIDQSFLSVMASATLGGVIARRLLPAAILVPVALGGVKLAVEHAGLVQPDVALTITMLSMIVVYLALLLRNAVLLDRTDAERVAAVANLEQSEERVKSIVQQASDAFVAVDAAGQVRHWNRKAAELFGVSVAEAIDEKLAELPAAIALPDEIKTLLTERSSGADLSDKKDASRPVEALLTMSDGQPVALEVSAFPVTALGERIACAFIRDVSERKAIEARFRDFYFTVSHELRSPVMSVMGNMKLARQDEQTSLSERSEQLLSAGAESCSRLIKLINDLLDVKRIEVGKFKVVVADVDVIEIAMLAVANLQGMAAMQEVQVETIIEAANTVRGDSDRLVQVVTNFLSNAIKFAPPKSQVILRVSDTESGGVRFAVSDQGPGVSKEVQARLFNRFEQGAMLPAFKQVSSGLGLSISKTIVEEHAGKIGVDSEEGKGASFWFELPAGEQQ